MDAQPVLAGITELLERHGAVVLRPYHPVSPLWRISRDEDGLQLDFMDAIHGVRSFAVLRKRASEIRIGSARVLVAALADIIKSRKAAARPQDLAVLPTLEKVLEEITSHDSARQAPRPAEGK